MKTKRTDVLWKKINGKTKGDADAIAKLLASDKDREKLLKDLKGKGINGADLAKLSLFLKTRARSPLEIKTYVQQILPQE